MPQAVLRLVVNNSGSRISSSESATPRCSAKRSSLSRIGTGMPREGQFKTVEWLTPKSAATSLKEPKRSSASRGSIMGHSKSRNGATVNPKSGRVSKNLPLHPKMSAQRMLAMGGIAQKNGAKSYGARLKTARQALGFATAKDFALHLGMKEQTYRNYERGDRKVSYEELQKIAEAGVSMDWLILGHGPAITKVIPLPRRTG